MNDRPVEAPVGLRADQWNTVVPQRRILLIAHNVTTVTRLLDVLPVFDSDLRIQLVASWSGTDPFQHGLAELLNDQGIIAIDWNQARHTRFDLAVSASHHGGIADITAPLVVLSHGIGYTKYSPGNRKPETGNRKPETGNRKPETGNRKPETGNRDTFGLSPQWVLYDGRPIAAALAFSHDEQVARLRAAAPAAESVAEVVGDPCYDRILASLDDRARYREALRTGNRTLVYVSSTWFRNALLGSWPDLLRRLMAELPVDSYQVAVALHPNIWHGHGPWQVRSWLADCVRAGMILLPEIDGWRTGLIAADIVIGDHGSVTGYGAALGRPTLLAAFADEDIDPRSPLADLAASAARLDRARRLRPQIEAALREHNPHQLERFRASITSVPGQALDRLRTVFYRLLDLDQPPGEPPLSALPAWTPTEAAPLALRVSSTVDRRTRRIQLTRRPAIDLWDPEPVDEDAPHLLCPIDHPQRTLRAEAAVITTESSGNARRAGDWTRATLRRHPGAVIAAILSPHAAIAEFRDGSVCHVSAPDAPADALPSVLCAWHLAGLPLADLEDACTLQLGETIYEVTVRRSTP